MRTRWLVVALTIAVASAGCGASATDPPAGERAVSSDQVAPTPFALAPSPAVTTAPRAVPPVTTTSPPPAPQSAASPVTAPPPAAPAPPPPPPAPPRVRSVVEQSWTPFATAEGVTLHHPSWRVERIGFHQSSHDGARVLQPLPGAADPVTMDDRNRGTAARTAADVVMDPAVEVRAPVSGTVIRAGTYVLYCEYSDDFVVIEPVDRPGWEVKVLHIDGVLVGAGQRVVAGETVLAPRPTQLPFESQVDRFRSADPAWPHVHLEVVDPSIPDRPSPGGGCPWRRQPGPTLDR